MKLTDWHASADHFGPVQFRKGAKNRDTKLPENLVLHGLRPITHTLKGSVPDGNGSRACVVELTTHGAKVTKKIKTGHQLDLNAPQLIAAMIEHLHDVADRLNDTLTLAYSGCDLALETIGSAVLNQMPKLTPPKRKPVGNLALARNWRRDLAHQMTADKASLIAKPSLEIDEDVIPPELRRFARRFNGILRPCTLEWQAHYDPDTRHFECAVTLPMIAKTPVPIACVSTDALLYFETVQSARNPAAILGASQLLAAARLARLDHHPADMTFDAKAYLKGHSDPISTLRIGPKAWAFDFPRAVKTPLRGPATFEATDMQLHF